MKLLPSKKIPTSSRQSVNKRGVFSYYSSPQSSPNRQASAGKKLVKRNWHYIPSLLAAIAVLICLGYVLKLDTNPKMALATTQRGVGLRTPQTYQQAAQKLLRRSWFNTNKLTVDTGAVEKGLKQQFPELNEVAVTLPLLGHRPVVELAAVQSSLLLTANNGRFIIASNGKAIAVGKDANPDVIRGLPVVTDSSGLTVRDGEPILPLTQIDFIDTLNTQLKLQQQHIQNLTLPPVPNEVDVHLEGLPYFIKFNTSLDARQQVGTFLAAKQKLDQGHITPAEYMDVRVEEKLFYK